MVANSTIKKTLYLLAKKMTNNPKRTFIIIALVNLVIGLSIIVPTLAQAEEITPEIGMKFMGAGIAVAGATIGAGIGLLGATSAGLAALVERPELSIWVLILAGLAEGVAIYGLIIAILILGA